MPEKYGDEDMFCKIKYYQTKWQEESINYFQVKQDVDSLYSNVDEVKLALKGVEEGKYLDTLDFHMSILLCKFLYPRFIEATTRECNNLPKVSIHTILCQR